MDSHKRSLLKTFSFRILATAVTFGIVWAFTGNLVLAGTVGVLDFVLKLGIYYLHERVWGKISWGRTLGSLQAKTQKASNPPESEELLT